MDTIDFPVSNVAKRRMALHQEAEAIERAYPDYDTCPKEVIARHAAICHEINNLRESPAGYFRNVDGEWI